MFIGMQKSIEFHLKPNKIPELMVLMVVFFSYLLLTSLMPLRTDIPLRFSAKMSTRDATTMTRSKQFQPLSKYSLDSATNLSAASVVKKVVKTFMGPEWHDSSSLDRQLILKQRLSPTLHRLWHICYYMGGYRLTLSGAGGAIMARTT